jgi:hypothetical protein
MNILRTLALSGVVLLVVCTGAVAETLNLAGEYTCHVNCPAGGEGKVARIEYDGTELVFINEAGGRSKGSFVNASTVVAED